MRELWAPEMKPVDSMTDAEIEAELESLVSALVTDPSCLKVIPHGCLLWNMLAVSRAVVVQEQLLALFGLLTDLHPDKDVAAMFATRLKETALDIAASPSTSDTVDRATALADALITRETRRIMRNS